MYARVRSYAGPGERVLVIGGQGHTAILSDVKTDKFVTNIRLVWFRTLWAGVAPADVTNVLPVLKANDPALFEVPDLDERLNVYEAMWQLLQLHHFRPGHTLDPVPRLDQLMESAGEV